MNLLFAICLIVIKWKYFFTLLNWFSVVLATKGTWFECGRMKNQECNSKKKKKMIFGKMQWCIGWKNIINRRFKLRLSYNWCELFNRTKYISFFDWCCMSMIEIAFFVIHVWMILWMLIQWKKNFFGWVNDMKIWKIWIYNWNKFARASLANKAIYAQITLWGAIENG